MKSQNSSMLSEQNIHFRIGVDNEKLLRSKATPPEKDCKQKADTFRVGSTYHLDCKLWLLHDNPSSNKQTAVFDCINDRIANDILSRFLFFLTFIAFLEICIFVGRAIWEQVERFMLVQTFLALLFNFALTSN